MSKIRFLPLIFGASVVLKLMNFSNSVCAEIFLVKLTKLLQYLEYSYSFNLTLLRNENFVETFS